MGQKTNITRSSRSTKNSQINEKEPDEIRADIERTRAEMGETINSIKEKLSPEHFKEQIREKVIESTAAKAKKIVQVTGEKAREVGSTILETMKHNSIPVGLIGMSLVWLVVRGTKTSSMRTAGPGARGKIKGITGSPKEKVQYQARRVKGKLQGAVHDNPLALGAAALALGAVVGLIAPETKSEEELVEQTPDTLMREAKRTAQSSPESTQYKTS
jgi:hypothetical protein